MEIKTYAPVIIPTLNRYEHFKRCLESLERCTGAEYTEVYVALDFPPSDKYKSGWKKIDDYLHEKEMSNGFKQLHVIRRDHNYGTCHINSNCGCILREQIVPNYESYILTEDDNEFSPCFLQYMNKCLERFYDDDRIFLVCGYNYKLEYPEMYKNNFMITKSGSPWGIAKWVHKQAKVNYYYSFENLKRVIKDDSQREILMERNPAVVYSALNMIKKEKLFGDGAMGLYSTLYDVYSIMPRVSMVRNWGNDGTGDHSLKMNKKQNDFYTQQEISSDVDFEFTDDIFTYEPVFLKRNLYRQRLSFRTIYKKIVSRIDLFLFLHFDFLPKSKYI